MIFASSLEFEFARNKEFDGLEGFGVGAKLAVDMIPDSSIGLLGIGGATGITGGAEPFNFVTSLFTLSLKEST
jgi:hypothetical protein